MLADNIHEAEPWRNQSRAPAELFCRGHFPPGGGHHRVERVLNSEVPCVRYLIGRIVKMYDYINRIVLTLPLSVYEGTWTTLSPLVAMHHHDLACA